MRSKNSIKNITVGILTQVIITLLGFLSRKVFLDSLGTEYLGINGLLCNVLSMLSLAEGGIGASIIYNLYKPLAEDDREKVISLVQLYKRVYGIIAIAIFILSMGLYPFLHLFIKDGTSIKYLWLVYFIFVIKNVISYLNAHKWSLINADQKGYVLARYNLVFNIITTICKILILKITSNYILYLFIELLIFIIQNIWNGKVVNNRYGYIKTKNKYKVDEDTRLNIKTNVKAMFLHNVAQYCVFGTDNLLVSSFINLKTVGIYSNYTMITGQLSALLEPVLNGVGASVGNLLATEGKEKKYKVFKVVYFVNFWIYSIAVIFLYNLLEPFICWWFGKNLLLDRFTFIVILINFYLTGLRITINIFKTKAGIFSPDKYFAILESIINLIASLILVRYLGLVGIFLGTTISTISIPIWIQSKLVYNKIFNKSVFEYFKKYLTYLLLTLTVGYISSYICNLIVINNIFIGLCIRGIICITIPSVIYITLFFNTTEFKYLFGFVRGSVSKVSNNLSNVK